MANGDLRTYNPDLNTLVVGGFPITGHADGTFFSVEAISEGITSESGADGEISRVMSTDHRCRVTITLAQTSPSNDVLSQLHDYDRRSGGRGVVPIAMTDMSGRTAFLASQAWIVNKPATSFSKGVETREWVFETSRPSVWHVGGNM